MKHHLTSAGVGRKIITLAILSVFVFSTFAFLITMPLVHASGITLVQGPARGTSTSSSISVTMKNTPTQGNMLIAVVGTCNSVTKPITVSSISETGVTWTRQVQDDTGYFSQMDLEIWAGVVGSGDSNSIKISLSGAAAYGAVADICEYSGLLTSGFLDKTATNNGESTQSDTGTTATTTQGYELWIGATAAAYASQNSPTNGFTLLDGTQYQGTSGSLSVGYLEYVAGSTAAADSGTALSGSAYWGGCIATFKATSSSPYPIVTLNSPINCTAYAHNPVTFSFTPEYAASAQLWMNVSGTWQSVASNQTDIINGAQNSINYAMPQNKNSYVWNIEVLNSAGTAFASYNFMITDSPLPSGMGLVADGSNLLNSAGQAVQLRDVGVEGEAPDLLFWTATGNDAWSDQWQTANSAAVTQTLQELSTIWHVNCIRMFIYPEWWWLNNVTPSVESGSGFSSTPVSTRSYIETFASECETYGVYLDIVPISLVANSAAFGGDPYASSSNGYPMCNDWSSQETAFLTAEGYGSNELGFWTAFWASMADALKSYPNVIFEAWNEPNPGAWTNLVPSGYLSYLTTMYRAIRGTGASNLIFMMWWDGWVPNGWGENMAWAGQIADAIGDPTNIVYNNHLYYYAPSDLTPYWDQNGVDNDAGGVPMTTAQIETQLQGLLSNMGISAPVVMNEQGDCELVSANISNDYTWWSNLLQAENALGIGEGAYYWLSDSGLGGVFDGNDLLTSGYTPNTTGQECINAYQASPEVSAVVSPILSVLALGQSVVITAFPSGGTSPYSYAWYVNGVLDGAQTGSTYTFSPSASTTVYVLVTDSASPPVTVQSSNTASIRVNAALAAPRVAVSASTVDQGQTSSLTSSAVTTGTTPYTYQWFEKAPGASSYSVINVASASSYSFVTSTSTATGTWGFILQVTDSTGAAVNSTAATVTVNAPLPTQAPTPTPTPTLTPIPSPVSSTTSTATVSNNSATVDQSATTGVIVTVSGSLLPDGTQINVTSTDYGTNQPSGTGAVSLSRAVYYDISVTSSSGTLSSNVSVAASISNPSFTSASVIEYWNGNSWVLVATTFTSPDIVSGTIPASALTGTPIVVGTLKPSTALTVGATTLLMIVVVLIAAVAVVLGILFDNRKKRKAK